MKDFLFEREIKLELIAPKLSRDIIFDNKFHIDFNIKKAIQNDVPNSGTITIFNLNETSREIFETEDNSIALNVGYKDNDLALLIKADIDWVESYKEGVDWVTVVTLSENGKDLRNTYVSKSYNTKISNKQIIDDTINEMKNTVKGTVKSLKTEIKKNGFSVAGLGKAIIGDSLKSQKLDFTVQNNKLHILGKNDLIDDFFVSLNKDTGLINVPRKTKKEKESGKPEFGLSFQSLLIPEIYPGRGIKLSYNGNESVQKVYSVVYDGSNYNQNWYCNIEASEI